jgi:hypothetical protein
MHSREEFDVLDRRLRHPALVNRECHDFAFGRAMSALPPITDVGRHIQVSILAVGL